MAISLKGTAGAWAAGTTAAAPTIPAHAVGDLLIVHVEAKPTATGTPPVFSTPSGWAKLGEGTNGSGAAQAADAGQTWHCSYYLIATATNHTISVTVTNGNVTLSEAKVFERSSSSHTWVTPVAVSAGDTSSGTGFALAGTLSVGEGDLVEVGCCLAGNTATFGAWGLSATGMTFGSVTTSPATNGTTNNGNDLAASACFALITAGTPASVTVTASSTLSAAQTGTGALVRLRETAPTYTGSAATTLAAATQAAEGTAAGPTVTGSAAQTLPALTQSAAGTVTLPSATGSAAQTLAALSQAATGTHQPPTFSGSAAQSLPSLTQSATGGHSPPTSTGTASQALPALSQQASGEVFAPVYTGELVQILPAFAQQATGTFTAGGSSYTGTIAQSLAALSQLATGQFSEPVYVGSASQALPALEQHAYSLSAEVLVAATSRAAENRTGHACAATSAHSSDHRTHRNN